MLHHKLRLVALSMRLRYMLVRMIVILGLIRALCFIWPRGLIYLATWLTTQMPLWHAEMERLERRLLFLIA